MKVNNGNIETELASMFVFSSQKNVISGAHPAPPYSKYATFLHRPGVFVTWYTDNVWIGDLSCIIVHRFFRTLGSGTLTPWLCVFRAYSKVQAEFKYVYNSRLNNKLMFSDEKNVARCTASWPVEQNSRHAAVNQCPSTLGLYAYLPAGTRTCNYQREWFFSRP